MNNAVKSISIYIPNQWIVLCARSGFLWISRASFPSFLRKKKSYLVFKLSTGLVYMYTKPIIHLCQCR